MARGEKRDVPKRKREREKAQITRENRENDTSYGFESFSGRFRVIKTYYLEIISIPFAVLGRYGGDETFLSK